MKNIITIALTILFLSGCKSDPGQPVIEKKREKLTFREIIKTKYLSSSRGVFYILNNLKDLDTLKKHFIYGTDEMLYNKLKNLNYSDSTLIGFTSAISFGSGANLQVDSLICERDTIRINYTFNISSFFQNPLSHTVIVAIRKTNLPIKIGELIYKE